MLDEKRKMFKNLENIAGKYFSKLGLQANSYSILSIILALVCLYFLTKVNLPLASLFFVLAASMDLIDGAVARKTNTATRQGAYIDTICDRYVEGIVILGLLFLPLPFLILPSKIWISIAFFGSLMTTYSKAAAKEKELVTEELRKGFLSRAERMILIFLIMIFGIFNFFSLAIYPLIILALFSNLTALQRIYLTLHPRKS